jgi:ribonuclease HI
MRMKQLSLFEKKSQHQDACAAEGRRYWKLFIDGASRNNPGQSGAGFALYKNEELIEAHGFYLGTKTNNQAEYFALVLGLFYLKKYICPGDLLVIVSDSQLLVRQVQGMYRVKNVELKVLHQVACAVLSEFTFNIMHVLREDNKEADALANQGIDKKRKPSQKFLDFLQLYHVTI